MTNEKLPDDFADNPIAARSIDDANAMNEASLWGMARAEKIEKELRNVQMTLGAVVDHFGAENLPSAEELAEEQEYKSEAAFQDYRFSEEGEERLKRALQEDGKRYQQEAEGEPDYYTEMWKKHKAETRGE